MSNRKSSIQEIRKRGLSPEEAESLYPVNKGTLANLRYQRRGPRFYRVGRSIIYRPEDLEAFLFSEPVETVDSCREGR